MRWFSIPNGWYWLRSDIVFRNLSILSLFLMVAMSEKGCSSLKIVEESETGRSVRIAVKRHAKDVTAELNTFIRSAQSKNIDTIVLSRGKYKISAPLKLYPGLTVKGDAGFDATIEQMTWGYAVFDLLDADSCSIENLCIVSNQDRQYPNGFESRGTDSFVGNAGIYSNSHHGAFRHLRISGFTCGIFLSSWNGSGLYEQKLHNTIEYVEVGRVDFGLLITGQKHLKISHISGTYLQQNGSGAAPHLIYISGANDTAHVWTEDFAMEHCSAKDGTEGSAYQIGSARHGIIIDLLANNCQGVLSGGNFQHLRFDSIVATNDQTNVVGSIFIRPSNVSDILISNVHIQSVNPEARLMLLNGTNNVYTNIHLQSATNRIWDHNVVVFEGENSIVNGLSLNNPSDSVGAVAILLAGKNLVLEDLSCDGCRAAFNVHPSCDNCIVRIDPKSIVAPRHYADFKLYFNWSESSQIVNISKEER